MQSVIISKENVHTLDWDEQCFRFCEFDNFSVDGKVISSDFISCRFKDIEWYWGLFSQANFIQCIFSNCTFRGTSFASARFVECEFSDCHFVRDNLNGKCNFSEALAYGCRLVNCDGFDAEVKC